MAEGFITRRGGTSGEPQYKIIINNSAIDSTLTNFPLTVKLSSSNFDMTKNIDTIYFVDDSNTILNHEVEYYDLTEGRFHILVPTVSSSVNTEITIKTDGSGYANGNNPTSVWDSSFVGVHHMSANFNDSTSNGNNGSVIGSPTFDTYTGEKAVFFDGVDDAVNMPEGTGSWEDTFYFANDWTFSYYVKTPNEYENGTIAHSATQGGRFFIAGFQGVVVRDPNGDKPNDDYFSLNYYTSSSATNTVFTLSNKPQFDTWYFLTSKRLGSTIYYYFNGEQIGTFSAYNSGYSNFTFTDGLARYASGYRNGHTSQMRLSLGARSDAFIKAEALSVLGSLYQVVLV